MQANKKSAKKTDDQEAVIAAIKAMPEPDRVIAEKIHKIIKASAPALLPRAWYGMPAYSNGDKIVCFFRSRQKFGERYMTLGFNDSAKLDEGVMWPIYYALTALNASEEKKIAELIKKAAG